MRQLLTVLLLFITLNGYSQYKGTPGKAKSSLEKSMLKTDIEEKRGLLTIAKGEIDAAQIRGIQLLLRNSNRRNIKEALHCAGNLRHF